MSIKKSSTAPFKKDAPKGSTVDNRSLSVSRDFLKAFNGINSKMASSFKLTKC